MADKEKRATSNVFAQFSQNQIQEFKEAFQMMDNDRDGLVDMNDLKSIYGNLGMQPKDSEIKAMLDEAKGQLNFTNFLSMLGEKMGGTDPEETLKNAFRMFDDKGEGTLPKEYVVDLLTNMGDNFTDAEMKKMMQDAPVSGDTFDYMEYVKVIKRGKQDE